MVGLSVILENYKDLAAKRSPQVINKGSMIKPTLSSPTSPLSFSCFSSGNNNNKSINNNNNNVSSSNISTTCGFLEICFLCKEKLMPGKDIYMYKGDRAFCSVECRCKQILMDEEETTTAAKSGCTREYNCSLAATSSSSSSSRRSSVNKKGTRNRANYNGFAY